MNDRTFKLGASIGAMALAVMTPAIASAQDQATPDTSQPAGYVAPAPMFSDSDQLDRLSSLGFINQSDVLTAVVDPNSPSNFGNMSSDQIAAALDSVQVQGEDNTSTLRAYLDSQGITPDTITSIHVTDDGAVIVGHT